MARLRKPNFESIMLKTAQHIPERTAEYQEDEGETLTEYVHSGAVLRCSGSENPEAEVELKILCVGDLRNGKPAAHKRHIDNENFVGNFGTCRYRQSCLAEMATSADLDGMNDSESGGFLGTLGGFIQWLFPIRTSIARGIIGRIRSGQQEVTEVLNSEEVRELCQCEITFEVESWENYAEGVAVGDEEDYALCKKQSSIQCKYGGTITVYENPDPIVHELVGQELFVEWIRSTRLELIRLGLNPDDEFHRTVLFAWENIDQSFIDNLNALLYASGVTNPHEIAHFLAQTAQETGFGRIQIEEPQAGYDPVVWFNIGGFYSDGRRFSGYSYRTDLGNQGGNDGFHFRGAGYIQLTGRVNYESFALYQLSIMPELSDLVDDGRIVFASSSDTGATTIHRLYNEAVANIRRYRPNVDISHITNLVPAVGASVDHNMGASAIVAGDFQWEAAIFFWVNNVRGWDGGGLHREIIPLFTTSSDADILDVSRAVNGNVVTPNHLNDRQAAFNMLEELFAELGCPYCGEIHEG